MDITLGKSDRVVVRYTPPIDPNHPYLPPASEGIELVVVRDGDSDDIYHVMWRKLDSTHYSLMWRGNWGSALKYFTDVTGDWEMDSYSTPTPEGVVA